MRGLNSYCFLKPFWHNLSEKRPAYALYLRTDVFYVVCRQKMARACASYLNSHSKTAASPP